MKGFMFFFMMFGLFAALGRDESAVVPKHDAEVVVEQPVVSTEPVIEEPVIQEPAVTEPVSYENAAYALTVKETDYLYEGADVPLYVKDGVLYSLSDEWNDGGYNSILTGKDLKTGNTVSKAVLEKHDVEDAYVNYVYPAKDGGYLSFASHWTPDGSDYYFFKHSADGKLVASRSLKDTIKLPSDSYVYGKVACDGENFYLCVQGYDSNGATGSVIKVDKDFSFAGEVLQSLTASVCVGNDNLVYINDAYRGDLYVYNQAADTLTLLGQVGYLGNCVAPGGNDEILIGESDICAYNTKTGVLSDIISFADAGYDVYYTNFIYRDYNGDVVVTFESFNDSSYTSVSSYEARLKAK